ncbi:MAG: glycerate dehydrogenase [Pseudohongiella sp.]|nr:MAG: glycerate dehydrogenase [Pseudohongiella sp.]
MSKKKHLVIANAFHLETISVLNEKYITHHLWELPTNEKKKLLQNLEGQCEAVATASWMVDEVIYELDSLKMISCFGVGVDAIDFKVTSSRNIAVSNTPDVLNQAVADIAIALILATTRNLISADRFVREKQWLQGPFPFGTGLAGKTLGIIGCGRIGEEIALRALTFGLKIAYHNRSRKDLPFSYHSSIAELAEASDILLCMLPGGESTKHAVNSEILNKLGPAGIFLNVGRGSSVDEAALVAALQNQHIFAAGLDVYADEPNVPEALLSMDNVVLLPHIGSATVETRRAMGQLVIDNLEAYFAGKPLLTEVS